MKSSDHQQQAANPPRNAHTENGSSEHGSSEDDSNGEGREWMASSQVESGREGTDQEETVQGGTDQVEGQSLGDRVMITIGTAVIGMNGGVTGISIAGWLIHMRGWSHEMVGDLSIVLASLLALLAAVLFWGESS